MKKHKKQTRSALLTLGVVLTMLLAFLGFQGTGGAATIGPAPTNAGLEASTGPLPIASITVPRQRNFGGGTIYYPTDGSQRYGGVAVVPGFLSAQSSIQWYGPRVASWGFVVITIDTLSGFDFPAARANQLQAALDYIIRQPTVSSRIDPNRLGVIGWSMGGGGAIRMARNANVKAIVPVAPWDSTNMGGSDRTPTFFVTCQNDSVATNSQHSTRFYNSIPAGVEKANLTRAGGSHSCGNSPGNPIIGKMVVSWLKRWIDGDTRFSPFLCPGTTPTGFSSYLNTCPF